jgi:hypothetical protein
MAYDHDHNHDRPLSHNSKTTTHNSQLTPSASPQRLYNNRKRTEVSGFRDDDAIDLTGWIDYTGW